MKRLLKYIFILLTVICCSFFIACSQNNISSEDSSTDSETTSEDSSTDNETTSEDSSTDIDSCDHDYVWNITKEATCTSYGEKRGVCPKCLDIEYKAIDLIPHDYTDGFFCKLCNTVKADFHVPVDFNGGLTIKEIENRLGFFNLSFDHLPQIKLSSVSINYKGLVSLSITYNDVSMSLTVPDLQCNFAVETASTSKISTLKVINASQLNVYAIDSENKESYIGSLNGTEKIERLFVNERNDLFAVYADNSAIQIGTLNAEQADESDGLIYRKIENKEEYAVVGFIETEEHIKIPDTFQGLPVTLIDDYAFEGNDSIRTVQIGNHINTIGNWAFWKCSSLEAIYLPNAPLTIKNGAFYKTKLNKIYYVGTEDDKKENIHITNLFNDTLFENNWIYGYGWTATF